MTSAQANGVCLAGGLLLLPLLTWGAPVGTGRWLDGWYLLIAGTVFIASLWVHEHLHLLGFRWGGASREQITVGMRWKALTPYAHCRVALTVTAYRRALILPVLAVGLVPYIAGSIGGWALLALIGMCQIACSLGDLLCLAMLVGQRGDAHVVDHPTRIGCKLSAS